MTKKLWTNCARKRNPHKEELCFEEGGLLCECDCHAYEYDKKEKKYGKLAIKHHEK